MHVSIFRACVIQKTLKNLQALQCYIFDILQLIFTIFLTLGCSLMLW